MKTKEELQEELTVLKAKHKIIYSIEVALNEDGDIATLFLKKPDRTVRSIIGSLAKDPIKAVEAALKNLYVGGDSLNIVTSNDDALVSCEDAIVEMLVVQKAVLKKN